MKSPRRLNFRAPTLRTAPAAELDACPNPHDQPDTGGQNGKDQVQNVVYALAFYFSLFVTASAKTAFVSHGHDRTIAQNL